MAVVGGCTSASENGPSQETVLAIGVPEGFVNGQDLGIGSLIRQSTLEGLTQVNISTDGRALPRLAESWVWENGGQRLRLKLRPNITFHDGTPFSSAIALEALQRAIDQAANRALYPSLSSITAVRPEGDLELVLELSQPSAFLPEELELPIAIGPGGTIGTGPFQLASRAPSNVVLERFDGYYLGAPKVERIVIRPFNTLRIAWTSLLRGEVDMVTDVPPEALDFVRNDDIQVVPFARSFQFLIAFNSQKRPFTSPAVRRALNVAVDRQALIANVLQRQGQPSTGPFWPKHWAYDSSILPYTFDPKFAAALLDGAGFRNGAASSTATLPPARLRFTCVVPADFALLERIGLEVQRQLFNVGVDMQFEVISAQDFDARMREGNFEAALVDMISGPTLARPHLFWASPRREGLHAFGYQNVEATRLFEILRRSTNEAAMRSAVARLQRVMLDDPPALFLAWNQRARAVSSRFSVPSESGRDPLLTIWQWTENSDRPPVSTQ